MSKTYTVTAQWTSGSPRNADGTSLDTHDLWVDGPVEADSSAAAEAQATAEINAAIAEAGYDGDVIWRSLSVMASPQDHDDD